LRARRLDAVAVDPPIVVDVDDDSLIGCRWKLQQAWRHLQTLDAEVDQFFARDETEPPMYLGVLVGDFLHNLRCTLDHLVWQLVHLNDQEPSERNQFPIFDTVERYRAKAPVYLAGSPQTLIETFQPFHLDGDPRDHMLAVLRRLSNIDKLGSCTPSSSPTKVPRAKCASPSLRSPRQRSAG
jgi:hypothetical protein